jgi:CHAT domain-containing protein
MAPPSARDPKRTFAARAPLAACSLLAACALLLTAAPRLGAQGEQPPSGREADVRAGAARLLAPLPETLASLGEGAVIVYAVPAPEALHVFLATPQGRVARESRVKREELDALASGFRGLLFDPAKDPRAAGKRLYDLLIRPLEPELAQAGAKTLALSLDGPLRLVPVAALWDGEKWLAERYAVSYVTEATFDKLRRDPPAGPPRAAAFGVSKALGGFSAAPGVADELSSAVKTPGSPEGALEGEIYLDGDFTRKALSDGLASGAQAVHVATHYKTERGNGGDISLLLGDGSYLSLKSFWTDPGFSLKNVDLLTLSFDAFGAAEAVRGPEESFLSESLQKAGASAVLSAVFPVSDRSAPALMREFYRRRYVEGKSKAQALQEAQLAVMASSPAASGGAGSEGAAPAPPAGSPASGSPAGDGDEAQGAAAWTGKGFSHPFHWAPYILVGNWK